MREFSVLYGQTTMAFELPEGITCQVVEPRAHRTTKCPEEILKNALKNPIGPADIHELTKTAEKILILTNDNTRPMPSRLTLPALIESFYHPEDHYDITILIATGLHRMMSDDEIKQQLGEEIAGRYKVVVHSAIDRENLISFGKLSSGHELFLNRLVAEADLVVAEGFIEPHFYAGFSGGRKSILPGVAGVDNILLNHSPEKIAHPNTRQATLLGNPVHEECIEAARMAKLRFILNVALGSEKEIIAAFAGHPEEAHLAGCRFVEKQMTVDVQASDIVITSNHGYPLDRNLYQVVKGLDTAAKAAKKGGIIIMAAECVDGIGHYHLKDLILSCDTVEGFNARMSSPPSQIDKWMAQVLARVLIDHQVILVSGGLEKDLIERMFFLYAASLDEAVTIALSLKGRDASVCVLPQGPVVIPRTSG